MSDFSPGFAVRHRAAAHVLQRAFDVSPDFEASAVERIGRRGAAGVPMTPKHFAPADPGFNPTAGWDPFSSEAAEGVQAAPDPLANDIDAAHAAGFEAGREAAYAELEEVRARELALLEQLSQALANGAHFDRDRMAGHLRQTVLHLVSRIVGEVGIAPDVLAQRISAAVDLLADSAESAILRMHPDDVALVEGKLPGTLFPVGDAHIARGGFVIESASTIVEDGPGLWLEQLAQAIDRVPIPPAC